LSELNLSDKQPIDSEEIKFVFYNPKQGVPYDFLFVVIVRIMEHGKRVEITNTHQE
jgi:hypothetical protein